MSGMRTSLVMWEGHRIERQLAAAQMWARAHAADAGDGERVAVRSGARHRLDTDQPARTALVLDDDRLSEFLGQRFDQESCREIDAAARRIGHDQLDRPLRILALGARNSGRAQGRDRKSSASDTNRGLL
jgi:hypothetical protein